MDSLTPSILNKQPSEQDSHKLHNAIWTTHETSILLKLYEAKLEMLQTPKKKKKLWIAISESFKEYDVDVTPDQVRWKINALTKKYKRCIDMGKHEKFKYFKELDKIYAKYNVDCDSCDISEFIFKKNASNESLNYLTSTLIPETKAMLEIRKARLASRINCVRFQGKIKLERQWLEYLKKQEEQRKFRDKIFEKKIKHREKKLETKKRELKLKEYCEYRKLELMEKEYEDFMRAEREKLEVLKQIIEYYD